MHPPRATPTLPAYRVLNMPCHLYPQVMPVTEMLQATCGRYHDLLGATLGSQMAPVVEADVLGELEVRTAAQHSQLVNDYNLPWQLEGAGERPIHHSSFSCWQQSSSKHCLWV